MNLEELLGRIKQIGDKLCHKFEEFGETLDEIAYNKSCLLNNFNYSKIGYSRKLFTNIVTNSQVIIANAQKSLEGHLRILEEKRIQVEQLDEVARELNNEHHERQKDIEKIKRDTETIDHKFEELQAAKDKIQTYKLLTGTSFVYQQTNTVGCILKAPPISTLSPSFDQFPYDCVDVKRDNPPDFEIFDFNEQMSEDQVTKKLWTLLENISKADHRNKSEEQLSNNKKLILS